MPDPAHRVRAAVLRPTSAARALDLGRAAPPATLAARVDYAWWVRWDLERPHAQEVVPRPVVHVALERAGGEDRLLVHGVRRQRFERRLEGRGATVAVAFRPATFRDLLGGDVVALRDREVPAADVLAADDRPVAARLRQVVDEAGPGAAADALLRWASGLGAEAAPTPVAAELRDLVELVERDVDLTRAEQLAGACGVSLRTLQRRFLAHVGVGPKWVLARSRLLDVADAAHAGEQVDWAGLAARLGYADQSHLVRAFRALVGRAPAAYARDA